MRSIKEFYEDIHGVEFEKDCFEEAVDLSKKYLVNQKLPDKAIDILDETAASVKINSKRKNKIFANAFGRDPQFFAFYRAMQAYEKALIGGETSLVLSPDSEFFKFFGKSIKPNIKR